MNLRATSLSIQFENYIGGLSWTAIRSITRGSAAFRYFLIWEGSCPTLVRVIMILDVDALVVAKRQLLDDGFCVVDGNIGINFLDELCGWSSGLLLSLIHI